MSREPRVVFGFHAVLSRLRADPSSVLEIFLDETRNDARAKDLVAAAERSKTHLMRVPTKRLDGFYGRVDAYFNDRIAEHVVGSRVLDFGCGFGSLVEALRTRGFDARASDSATGKYRSLGAVAISTGASM